MRIRTLDILTKALKPLPEKYKGLLDTEERYRKRYLDLLFNEASRDTFLKRAKIIQSIRDFLTKRGFLEVETPILQAEAGGANARPFETHFNALKEDYFLRIATELPLKKLLVGDLNKVFEIGRIFRNEGVDTSHNPEFTSIEFYESYIGIEETMMNTEDLIRTVTKDLLGEGKIEFKGKEIDIDKPFKRLDYIDAVAEASGIDIENTSFDQLKEHAKALNIKVESYFTKNHIIAELFGEFVEDNLIEPTFIVNHPIEISPLSRRRKDNPELTERAELFIAGKEVANMFSELNDPIDQHERFKWQLLEKEQGNDEATGIDHDFLEALRYGMPPAGGCGIGIDRLVMLLTGKGSIRDVLLFPQLRKQKTG